MNDLLDTIEDLTPEQAREALRFANYAAALWTVESKGRGYVPFVLTPAQRIIDDVYERMWAEKGYVRLNILKCRQMAASTYWIRRALQYMWFFEAANGISVAHELGLPGNWVRKVGRNITETPPILRPGMEATKGNELRFDNGSRYYIGSAQGTFPGMGDTLHFVHLSEVGRWDKPPISRDPDEVLIPLTPAIPTGVDMGGTVVVYESTGVMQGDWWYNKWQSGKEPEDEYENIFVPWFLVHTYCREDLSSDVLALNADERAMVHEAGRFGVELSKGQIAWYRNELRQPPYYGNLDAFRAEFPTTEDEAFMSPGASIYTPEEIRNARATVREPVWRGNLGGLDAAPSQAQRLDNAESGELHILEWPEDHLHYALGADCMWGRKKDADWDYLHVECLETGRVVAWMKTQCTMHEWAWKIAAVGFLYNTCPVAPERNSQAGSAADGVINTLLGNVASWRYPAIWIRSADAKLRGFRPEDYGWYTDHLSKGQLIAFSQQQTALGAMDWADGVAVSQMATIIRHADNSIGAPEGAHDDAWMSRLITAYVAHRLRPGTDLYVEPETTPKVLMTSPEERLLHMWDDDE